MCHVCFTTRYDFSPEMGDDCVTFTHGTCSACGADAIVWSLTDDFA